MLIDEARWLGQQLHALPPDRVYPLLDIGSSTARFRTRDQPWIDEYIFAPARRSGHTVLHLDAKQDEGVDIVADLSDKDSLARLAEHRFRSLLCSNLLEHVVDPVSMARAMLELVPPDGYLFLSGPYRYPIHPDPIDNRFRPTPAELERIFPGTRLLAGAIVRDGTYLDEILRTPAAFTRLLLRLLAPFHRPAAWRVELQRFARNLPWTFRHFEASCAVLLRQD